MSSSTGATATAIHSLLHLQSQVSGAHASCQAAKPRFCGSELLRKHPRRSWRSYSLDPGCKTLALRDIRHIQTSCLWFGLVSQLAAKTLCISLDDFVLQTINFGTKISQNPDASPGFDELSTCHILPPPTTARCCVQVAQRPTDLPPGEARSLSWYWVPCFIDTRFTGLKNHGMLHAFSLLCSKHLSEFV